MKFTNLFAAFIVLTAANGVNAACNTVSVTWPHWNFKVFDGKSCTGKSYEYYGTSPLCKCIGIGSPLADHVNSFVYSAPASRKITIFKDAGCKGTQLGKSLAQMSDQPWLTAYLTRIFEWRLAQT
jgi:hypothetical protein